MALGVIGRKCGMTRVFTAKGDAIPVTVVEVLPNRVVQQRSLEVDGYLALQLTTGFRQPRRVSKPITGHLAKAGVGPGRCLYEFRTATGDEAPKPGQEVGVNLFKEGQQVDVTGRSIGKGFAGGVKRHHFRMQDATHGNSLSHRAPGSIGQNQTPGRVFKGKRMAGHMGAVRRTVQNLDIVRIDSERGLLLIKGAVPGAKGTDLIIRPAVKSRK